MNDKGPILLVEDDKVDAMTVKRALKDIKVTNPLYQVSNGEEALEFLRNKANPRPGIILLDLNMPKKDGREALKDIKSDPHLRLIPVVVLTTSKAEEDILRTYDMGVSSFITKPVTFTALVDVMKTLSKYWFEIVELPKID